MRDVPGMFASAVFNDSVMKARLPKDIYKSLRRTIETGEALMPDVANVVANAMKNWAIDKGATHFTHWFQPMTGVTAEKHDSFLSLNGDGKVIMEFSGKELVRGEPDASSFPSGGLRLTFEARGYTAWDPTASAFIKDSTLFIPTVFFSYSGEVLDKKTPLLRSMEAINNAALRVLKLFGHKAQAVVTTVGPEQEYFLVDIEMFKKRPDLKYCGRTLLGARPPKGQDLEDHYFGAINERVAKYMKELEEELWKLGIPAKTKHNEVAPAQYELAPIYESTNTATDHNQLTMELMKSIAVHHGLVCLLHEKPFAGVNGSGKHNNWSLCTDKGINLLEPGDTPAENAQFLLFLTSVIKAVDEYQDLLRVAVASAGNDHRLGANEAPPAIVSMFLGDELTQIMEAIETDIPYVCRTENNIVIGATVLPPFPKDTTDRNRTSPFAFTGNKFEFRMLGSAFSVSGPNIVLNTIVAESLTQFADELEASKDFNKDLSALIKRTIKAHKRIVFNGNNYSDEWIVEAENRGLLNLKSTVDALPTFIDPKNIELFERHKVFSKNEIHSRYEILVENYCKTIHIEALTMIDMIKKAVIPSVIAYQGDVAKAAQSKKALAEDISTELEIKLLKKLSSLSDVLGKKLEALEDAVLMVKNYRDVLETAIFYRDKVVMCMVELRNIADELETLVGREYWAYPDYGQILFSVE